MICARPVSIGACTSSHPIPLGFDQVLASIHQPTYKINQNYVKYFHTQNIFYLKKNIYREFSCKVCPSQWRKGKNKQTDNTYHIVNLLDWVGFCHRHGYQTSWRLLGTLSFWREKKERQKKMIKITFTICDKRSSEMNVLKSFTLNRFPWISFSIEIAIPSTVLNTPFVGGSYMYITFFESSRMKAKNCAKNESGLLCVADVAFETWKSEMSFELKVSSFDVTWKHTFNCHHIRYVENCFP